MAKALTAIKFDAIASPTMAKPQHFLLSAKAKTLSLVTVLRMTDSEAEAMFRRVRWPQTEGEPICPECGGLDPYSFRHPKGALRYECRACRKEFSITSGTLFASHKLPLRLYLAAIAIFVNEVKGKNALALSRDLGLAHKSAFVLLHKIREALASELYGRKVGGPGKIVEIDAAYFGGYIKPRNSKRLRKDRRKKKHSNKKRKAVVVVRERGGTTLPAVFDSESSAIRFIQTRVLPGTVIHADESPNWNVLRDRFKMERINHEEGYSIDGACTNWAESYFSRLRRSEIGHHHRISSTYLLRYAQEGAWREDYRRVSNGDQVHRIAGLVMRRPPSVDFSGYWQRGSGAAA